jgi:hypothetical protein
MKKWLANLHQTLGILTKQKEEQTGLFIPNRQVSWVISGILIFGFLCLILGYFWGHRRALQRFVAKIEEESFADRINYALYTMNDRDISEFEQEQEDSSDTNGSEDTNGAEDQEELVEVEEITESEKGKESKNALATSADSSSQLKLSSQTTENEKEKKESIASLTVQERPTSVFVAPLAGFGTLLAATEFVERIKIFDPQATAQKRLSKTPKGRTVAWYQVITGEFTHKEDLEKVTNLIQKKEHIKKVEIIEKRKG